MTQFRRGGDHPLPSLGREIVVSDVGIDERPPLADVDVLRLTSPTAPA
jgi:glucosyl-3-phosphoglycerate synthase